MLKHYFKIAFRNLWKNKGFTFINIAGLAIGMACSLLIFLYVKDESSYDAFHKDADRIHRVVKDFINDDGSRIPDATSPGALAPAMQREIPEIEKIARFHPSWGGSWVVKYKDKKLIEQRMYRADSSLFNVFSFHFIKGDPKTIFNDLNSVVITQSVAKRYFGDEDPMGKTISINPGGDKMVTGVIEDLPENMHFHFDFVLPWRVLGNLDDNWDMYNYYTYVKVKEGTDMIAFNKKVQGIYKRAQNENYSDFYTQPLTSIHLNSHLKWELEPNGDQLYVYIFTIIGIFVLLIAAINYINLSTAKSALRAKEIGIRKVSGAVKFSLVKQFLLESVITCLTASIIAIIIAELLSPLISSIIQKELTVIGHPLVMIYMLIAALFTGLVAGIVPALYLSSFKPIVVLKGFKLNESKALNLRKSLVVLQFAISIVLIIGALIVAQQIDFIRSAKLGFNKEQVVVVRNAGFLTQSDRNAFQNEAKQLPGVKKIAPTNLELGTGFATTRLNPKGSNKEQQMNFSAVGYGFTDVMGIQLKEGRGFSEEFPGDTMSNGIPNGPLEQVIGSIIINERAVKDFGLGEHPIGKQLEWNSDGDTTYYVNIIGVMKDFHFTSLRNEIKPFALILNARRHGFFAIKLSTDNISNTLAQLEGIWKKTASERAFEYGFLDDTFARLYTAESRFQKVVISLVVLGILIACLGLLGLATYSAQQRVKEIGIRKTLGASVMNVVGLLSKDFLKLVLIGLIIAIPVGWYAMNRWLEEFHYRINIHWWVFLLAGVVAVVVAFATISLQTIKAARANPVKSLRTE